MKNIIKSLVIITAVAAVVVGGTKAYFSDTVSVTENTFITGTIDIDATDGNDQALESIAIRDMKPGYTDYGNFTIENIGSNPANVWKKLNNFSTTRNNGGDQAVDLAKVIVYDLSVKVYRQGDEQDNPFWWQTIYVDSDGETLESVYGSMTGEDNGILLGMIPAGGHMDVVQSYHMDKNAGNEYQDETFNFDMMLYAEQLTNTVTMVYKTGDDWADIDQDSEAEAVLTYGVRDSKLNYTFSASGVKQDGDYVLLSSSNPWDDGTNTNKIGEFNVSGGMVASTTGSVDLQKDLTNAKVWFVPVSSWSGDHMDHWEGDKYLFETALIDYYDTDL